jgi:hypothetical protein
MFATAINHSGEPLALHGSDYDENRDLGYYRFKDFTPLSDDDTKSRPAGTKGGLSNRLRVTLSTWPSPPEAT